MIAETPFFKKKEETQTKYEKHETWTHSSMDIKK
jgi:hypothetical protein